MRVIRNSLGQLIKPVELQTDIFFICPGIPGYRTAG